MSSPRHNTSSASKYEPIQVAFEYFRKSYNSPCIQTHNDLTDQSKNYRSFTGDQNTVLVCAFAYVSYSIRNRLYAQLCRQLVQEVDFQQTNLINQPDCFREFMSQQTAIGMLLAGLTRLEKYAKSCNYDLLSIQQQLSGMCNNYPFFRFCLCVWARCKSIIHCLSRPELRYQCAGNQQALLSNLNSEPRNTTLEIICRALDLSLRLRSGKVSEEYGRKGGIELLGSLLRKEIQYQLPLDDRKNQVETTSSEKSSGRLKGRDQTRVNMGNRVRQDTSGTSETSGNSCKSKVDLMSCDCLGYCKCNQAGGKKGGFLSPKFTPSEQYGFSTARMPMCIKTAHRHTPRLLQQ